MFWGGRSAKSHAGARAALTVAWLAAFTPLSPVACGPATATARPPAWPEVAAEDAPRLRLSDVQQKATHNSYARDEGLTEQLDRHGVRGLELDVHAGRRFRPDAPGDFYVYHVDLPGFAGTSCERLSGCLAEVAAWHRAAPGHDVLAVFVDLKDRFEPGHSPDDLDARLREALGDAALFRPADAIARCPGATGLADATARCGWPRLDELAGKVVVAVTGGTACGGGPVAEYVAGGAAGRAAFAAPNLDASCPLEATQAIGGGAAFANLGYDDLGRVAGARAAGVLTRVYYGGLVGGLDDAASWDAAAAAGASFLATDAVDARTAPWASTASGPRFAFRALPPALEAGPPLRAAAR